MQKIAIFLKIAKNRGHDFLEGEASSRIDRERSKMSNYIQSAVYVGLHFRGMTQTLCGCNVNTDCVRYARHIYINEKYETIHSTVCYCKNSLNVR